MSTEVKLAYNPAQRRIRLEFTALACFTSEINPGEYIERARDRMDTELNTGKIQQYLVYDERLLQLWQNIPSQITEAEAAKHRFSITLALGGPKYKNCIVSAPTGEYEHEAFRLSFKAQEDEIANWNIDWYRLHIAIERRRLELGGPGHPAQILAAWVRGADGETIADYPIMLKPGMDTQKDKPFRVVGNRSRAEASLILYDHQMLNDKDALEKLLLTGNETAQRMTTVCEGFDYGFRKTEMALGLKNAISGVERVGLDMPIVLLVALGKKDLSAEKSAGVAADDPDSSQLQKGKRKPGDEDLEAGDSPGGDLNDHDFSGGVTKKRGPEDAPNIPKNYPAAGMLDVIVSEDGMEATIGDWDPEIYKIKGFQPSKTWIMNEAARYAITNGIARAQLVRILDGLARKKNISGYLLAQGSQGTPGKKPFLYPVHKDKKQKNLKSKGEDTINIRDAQTTEPVVDGEFVAEIRYQSAEVLAKDVYGNEFSPVGAEKPSVKIGEGIEEQAPGKYYATQDGMPVINGLEIFISSKYIHEGDVNLKTGNIYFDGPVEIKGGIDSGATVIATGDLVVTGPIRNALVRSGGNIEAKGGIVTSEKGRVQAAQDIRADFIENSNITCGGNLIVRKSVSNCNVIVGGSIEIDRATGVLAGGNISCKQVIHVAKLGFPKGNKSYIHVGVDWKVELAVQIRSNRLKKLEQANADDRLALRELVRKKKNQMTARHQEMMDNLQNRLQRQRVIIDKLTVHLKAAEDMLVWDKEAKVYVYELLSTNVDMTVGGNPITVSNEVAAVLISTKKRRGTYIVPLGQALNDNDDD